MTLALPKHVIDFNNPQLSPLERQIDDPASFTPRIAAPPGGISASLSTIVHIIHSPFRNAKAWA
ncbi:hypothetical protein [Pseudomonas mohnii]